MKDTKKPLERRTVLAGAGAVGALAAAAAVLPSAQPTAAPAKADVQPLSDSAAGYRLSEHVKRYYATTRI
jgi:hypothetical protein